MQLKKGITILMVSILCLGVVAYVVYAMIVASTPSPDDKCKKLELAIEQNRHAGFITNEVIENELRKAGVYPKDRLMADIKTSDIETVLAKNEFVEHVECYKTANNAINIDICQRTPVIYVLPDNTKGYYVDTYGKVISKANYPVNLPVATGNISQAYAQKYLSKLGPLPNSNSRNTENRFTAGSPGFFRPRAGKSWWKQSGRIMIPSAGTPSGPMNPYIHAAGCWTLPGAFTP